MLCSSTSGECIVTTLQIDLSLNRLRHIARASVHVHWRLRMMMHSCMHAFMYAFMYACIVYPRAYMRSEVVSVWRVHVNVSVNVQARSKL